MSFPPAAQNLSQKSLVLVVNWNYSPQSPFLSQPQKQDCYVPLEHQSIFNCQPHFLKYNFVSVTPSLPRVSPYFFNCFPKQTL